jgi:TonB family protein
MPGKRVLLVDYDPRNLTHTRELLEGAGFDVSTCGDGLSALDQFKSAVPDLVLLSAMLPKMHGFEVCSSIRKLPGGDKTPVVIITDVYKGKRYRVDAINKYGATEYIERPIEDENLLSILTGLVKKNGGAGEAEPVPSSAPAPAPAPAPEGHLEEKTVQFNREELMGRVRDEAAFVKPKNVSDKPKSKDEMERKLEQSLAGLDLGDLSRRPKPKPKPAAPAVKVAGPPEPVEPAKPAAAASPPAPPAAETARPTLILGKAEPGGSTFTSEDLFTDVIASVERELQSEKVPPQKTAPLPAAAPPPIPQPAPPAPAPTVAISKEALKAPPPPEPPKPVETAKPVEAPKAAEPAKKAKESEFEKKVSSTLSGLVKEKAKAEAAPAKPAAPVKAAEPPKPVEKKAEPPKAAEPAKPAPAAAAPPPKPEMKPAPAPPPKPEAKPAPAPPPVPKPEPKPAPAPVAKPAAAPTPPVKEAEPGINFGQYLLLGKIATGGMAELYKAKRKGVEGFEKILAIKKILPHMSDNEEFITMFIDEAKLAAQLTHHNICQIFDLGKIENSYYIAMEYVHGKDLRAVLKSARSKEKPIPVELAILIISKICSALDYAHRKRDLNGQPLNLVHRDISPQNILISYEGEVKLVDFGIAKAATKVHVTQHGALKGKLLYMSPEQAWGRSVDRRSDLFSLGVVLYELLTGRPLFFDDNDTEVTILEKVREARVIPVREINQRVPPDLEKIITKALNKKQEDRYQLASEMQKDLDNLFYAEGYNATSGSLANFVRSLFPEDWGQEVGVKETIIMDKEMSRTLKASQPASVPPPAPAPPPEPAPAAAKPAPPPPPPAPKVEKPQPVAARPAEEVRIEPTAPPAPPSVVRAPETPAPGFRDISVPDIMAPQEKSGFPKFIIAIAAVVVIVGVIAFLLFRKSGTTEQPQQSQQQQQQTQNPPPATTTSVPPATTTTTTTQPPAVTPEADKQKEEQQKLEEQKKLEAQKTADEAKKQEEARKQQEQAKLQQEAQTPKEQPKQEPAVVQPPKEEPKVEDQPPAVLETPKQEAPPPKEEAPEEPAVKEGDLVELTSEVVKPEVLTKVNPIYPPVAVAKKIEGTVILSVLISETGAVLDAKVLRGAGGQSGLNEAAVTAIRKWKFRPAVKAGKRVKVWMTYPIVFKLQ